ncbi:ABC transporter substrate-binding protein [Methylomarinum vadi]|uniref:ABC transporter substrate-binding protein n=1 Tax=Methylomarinum vadi TaxID=438855 RepID=UPI00068E3623|nr:ABC transporter substrate binding protein [Methylomarinum vadi]
MALSANQSILIVADASSRIHDQVVKELRNHKFRPEVSVDYSYSDEIIVNTLNQKAYSLAITLGFEAALLINQSNVTTLNTLLSRFSIADRRLCFSSECPNSTQHYSIVLDQPIARQLNLLTTILPSIEKVGVLTANFSANKTTKLQQETVKRHLQLITRRINSPNELNHQFDELCKQSDVILALPDPMIHNRETVPYLLLTSYRYNIPFIGFSKAYVNAGAISAVFSSPKQIARHIRELAEQILTSGSTLKQKLYPPKYFSVSTNKNVAQSLEIRLPQEEQIKTKLLQMEK